MRYIYHLLLVFKFHLRDFQSVAIKVLDSCYAVSESKTEQLLTSELTQFPGHTCLSLASAYKQEEFIAHSSVQQLLNDVWTGAIKTREVPAHVILAAILFPPLIGRFDFRDMSEIKKMASTEVNENEEDFEIDEEKSVTNPEKYVIFSICCSGVCNINDDNFKTAFASRVPTPMRSYCECICTVF